MDDEMRDVGEMDSPIRVAATTDEQDVWSLYNLVLRRDPEARQVTRDKVGRPIDEVFAEVLGSVEFYQNILPSIITKTSANTVYRGTQSLGELLVWAAARMPVRAELRERLLHARSWTEFDEIILTDAEILDKFPNIRAASVDRALELKRQDPVEPQHEIRGAVDYANVWEVKGWCANAKNLRDKLSVDIFADNDLLGTAKCTDYRRDVHEKLGGDGRYGFTFTIPAAVQESFRTQRRLTVRERTTGSAIGNSLIVRSELPSRTDALDALREQVLNARDAVAGLELQLSHLSAYAGYPLGAYDEYVRNCDRVTPELAAKYRRAAAGWAARPTISIVLLIWQDCRELLQHTLRSIQEQLYENWDLVIVGDASSPPKDALEQISDSPDLLSRIRVQLAPEHADVGAMMREGLAQCEGSFVLFLQAGDRLAPDALYQNAVQLQQPGIKAIYADEDSYVVEGDGQIRRHRPMLKPDFDLDYLLSGNYVGRFVLFERAMLSAIGASTDDITGAESLDILLRYIEFVGAAAIVHLPYVIYSKHETDEPAAPAAGASSAHCRAVSDYLARSGLAATAEPHMDECGTSRSSAVRIRWLLPAPKASLIIPTKDHPELIGPCIASLLATTRNYRGDIEILVMNNGTTDLIASVFLKSLGNNRGVRVIDYPKAFNWSAINNRAADEADGNVLVFLNNDILAISEGWLDELAGQAMRPDIGAVGARLLFPDGTVQHAGIVLGINGSTCHEAIGEAVENGGYLGRSHLQRRSSAVTGACLATRKDVFQRLMGFDEAAFKVTYNDVDYCLKAAAAGLGVVYTPFATLHHFESASRGFDSTRRPDGGVDDELSTFRARWPQALRDDPFYNPHFSRSAQPFTYLSPSKRR